MGKQHDQKDMVDDLPHRPKCGKIYCPHCKKESPDYYDNCINCGKDVGYQLGQKKTEPEPKGWISRDSGNLKSNDRAFQTGWSVMKGWKAPPFRDNGDADYQFYSQEYDEDGDANEPSFGKHPCDTCHQDLGGNRHKVIAANQGDEENVTLHICDDCLMRLVGGYEEDPDNEGGWK